MEYRKIFVTGWEVLDKYWSSRGTNSKQMETPASLKPQQSCICF